MDFPAIFLVIILTIWSADDIDCQRLLKNYPCPKECSCYLRNSNKIIVDVVCKVEAINSQTKFSIIQTNITSNLYITCNSTKESSLPDNIFIGLRTFSGLRIRRCLFRYIPRNGLAGLHALQELAIENAKHLQIHSDAFRHSPYLTRISVVYSGLQKMAKICKLPVLKFLNLTGNSIRTLGETGIVCPERRVLNYMMHLILDNNYIQQIERTFGMYIPNLWQLSLSNNYIDNIQPGAFDSVLRLGWLDMTNNSISKIPDEMLANNTNIKLLGLGNNQFGSVPSGLLRSTLSIQILGLVNTNINSDIWQELKNLMNLTELQLGKNNINRIDRSVLQGMKYVEHLDLKENKIDVIETNSFIGQGSLETLYLSNNMISNIQVAAFRGLSKLKKLDISYNSIQEIPRDNFKHTSDLLYLNISYNKLTNVPDLRGMTKLSILDLRNNLIKKFKSSTFEGLYKLEGINLIRNRIEYIQDFVFTKASNLRMLQLSYNNISYIGYDAFKDMASLSWISLDHNNIEKIELIFTPLPRLFELDLSNNEINEKIRSGMFSSSVSFLNLQGNNINNIDMYAFYEYSKLAKVDLRNNSLRSLTEMSLSVSPRLMKPPVFLLGGNKLLCDCRLTWLRKQIQEWPLEDQQYVIEDMTSLTCEQGFRMEKETLLKDVAPSLMLCTYRDECRRDTCVCCEYHGCICRYMCPKQCTCYRKSGVASENHVVCSDADLKFFPHHIPSVATDLYLDGNNITELYRSSNSFVQLQNVRSIYLNNTNLRYIERGSFIGLMDLVNLFLNDNLLQKLPNGIFNGLESLISLYLQNNSIYYIADKVFANLQNLRYLSLANNKLYSIPESLFNILPALFDVKMGSNRWECDCDQTPRLKFLITSDNINMSDSRHVWCELITDNNRKELEILSVKLYELCPGNYTPPESIASIQSRHYLISMVAIALSIFIIFLAFALICMSREFIQVVIFSKCGIRMCHDSREENKIYDAYISYSRKDEQFVFQEIVSKLEGNPYRYKLCVHFREFPVLQTIGETIYRSIDASRRTIIVLSDNLLNNEWRNSEFQVSHQNALKNNAENLIIVQKDYLDRRLYGPGLKLCLNSKVYIKNSDPWFFEKLCYAMPERIRHNRHSRRPSHLRLNTVSGTMQDDEGYETPVSVASFDQSKRFSENFSLHSANLYEEIDTLPKKKMLS